MNIKIGDKDVKFARVGGEVVYPSYIKDGLVLWYDFSGRSNTDTQKGIAEDLSGNGNDGVLNNFAYDAGSGYEDNGLEFDGVDDEIDFNAGSSESSFTISICLKLVEEINTKILRSNHSHNGSIDINSNGSIRYIYQNRATQARGDVDTPSGIDLFNRKIKVDVVYEEQNKTVLIYLNGTEFKRQIIDDGILDMHLRHIMYSSFSVRHKGIVYSFKKYSNKALSSEEIAHNYKIDKHRFKIEEI